MQRMDQGSGIGVNFPVAGDVFYRETRLDSRGDPPLVESNGVSWGCSGGLSLGEGLPPAMLAQVGAVCEGMRRGGKCDC